MAQPEIKKSELKPLDELRLRPSSAYQGTITEPGDLVSDGKVIFPLKKVPAGARELAESMAKRLREGKKAVVPQERAEQVFRAIAKGATKKAQVIGQISTPAVVQVPDMDNMAVLRYGRGRSIRYVCVNAHRLLLLQQMTSADEIRCGAPREPVLLRRKGKPVAVLTALSLEPQVKD